MDRISVQFLVIQTGSLLQPYIKKSGEKLLEKEGLLPEAIKKLWDLVKEKMESRPETADLLKDMLLEPESPVVQGAFQYQLGKLLEQDEAFAQQLDPLVKEAKEVSVATMSATLTGGGAIAQGVGATAVGKGGVMIGGNFSENIAYGNNDGTSNDLKKKKND